MGLGPNGQSILPRINVRPLGQMTQEEVNTWMRERQVERSTARALGALKRREGKPKAPKVPKPRKHKHHCFCIGTGESSYFHECCRCKGEKCLKPKGKSSGKRRTKTESSSASVAPASVQSVAAR